MRYSRRQYIVMILCGVLLTACTNTPDKNTTNNPPSATTSAQPPTNTISIPPRPSTIPLTSFDPCTWFTPKDHPEFKIDVPGGQRDDTSSLDVKECVWNVTGASYAVGGSTTKGVEHWTDPRGAWKATLGTVADFPAIRAVHNAVMGECTVAVDIAPGQQVVASVIITDGFEEKFPPKCEAAETLATSAMRALGAKG